MRTGQLTSEQTLVTPLQMDIDADVLAVQDSATTIPTKSSTRLEQYDYHLGSIACGWTYC